MHSFISFYSLSFIFLALVNKVTYLPHTGVREVRGAQSKMNDGPCGSSICFAFRSNLQSIWASDVSLVSNSSHLVFKAYPKRWLVTVALLLYTQVSWFQLDCLWASAVISHTGTGQAVGQVSLSGPGHGWDMKYTRTLCFYFLISIIHTLGLLL